MFRSTSSLKSVINSYYFLKVFHDIITEKEIRYNYDYDKDLGCFLIMWLQIHEDQSIDNVGSGNNS